MVKRLFAYIIRHIEFILIDISAFSLAYYLTVQVRRAIDIPIKHDELFSRFGLIALFIFLIVEILNRNLNGIVSRSLAREIEAVSKQIVITWSVFTVILFLNKDAHLFSRAIYIITFFFCYISVLIARTILKSIIRNGKDKRLPHVVIVCDVNKATKSIDRLIDGMLEAKYQIRGVVVNSEEKFTYHDYFPLLKGLDKLTEFVSMDRNIQAVYVDLDDPNEEKTVIREMLNRGIVVYRGLGDSKLEYANQYIKEFSDRSVIAIEGLRVSPVHKIDDRIKMLIRKISKNKQDI